MPTGSTKTTKKVAKTVASVAKPRRRRTRSASPTHDQIAERAYHLSLDGGGDEVGNWLRAEQELSS